MDPPADDPAKTDEGKDPAKPEDGKDPKDGDKPPEYELKLPEGVKLDDAQLAGVKDLFAKAKVAPDQAQALLDEHLRVLRETADAPIKLWHDTQKQWQDAVKADPEIGGANLAANLAKTRSGVESLLGKDAAKAFYEALSFTGAGNNPAIVKSLFKAFSIHAEGAHVSGKPAGEGANKSAAQTLYPTQQGLGNASLK